jgi:hypothetical protein
MSEAAQPLPFWKSFWKTLTRFDAADVSASMAARNALCITDSPRRRRTARLPR